MSEKDLNNELEKDSAENIPDEQETEPLEQGTEPLEQETEPLDASAENAFGVSDNSDSGAEDPKSRRVNYEENDNWQFDASAPAAESNVFDSVNGVEFELESAKKADESAPADEVVTEVKSQNIVLKKERVSVVLSVLLALVIIAILVILGIRYYTVPNSNEKMNPGNVAMTVGNVDVSVGLYNYYYDSVVYEYTYYANYGYYDLDSTQDFSTQYTTDSDGNEISWLDLFEQTTTDRIKTNLMYYEKGVDAGITLTDEQKEDIESQLDMVRESASEAGQGVNEFCEESFGAHCGLETLRKYMEQYYIAGTFYNQYRITDRPTDEELDAYFEENQNNYKSCSYALIEMEYDSTDDTTKQQSIENAEKYMAQITDVDSMRALIPTACADLIDQFISAGYFDTQDEAVAALSESVEFTQARTDIQSSLGEDIANWMFDENTAVGSTTYYVNENVGVIDVLLKTGQPFLEEDSEVYSVRHILVIPGSDDENENDSSTSSTDEDYTDEEWQAAYDKAQEILAEYNAGDKTELSFALLAEEYSDDTATTSAGQGGLYGGAYEDITPGSSAENFENWALDSSRKYGDVDIVQTEYGYHIMFFISKCPEYMYDAEQDCFNDEMLNLLDNVKVKSRLGMKNVNYADPSSDYVASQDTQQY